MQDDARGGDVDLLLELDVPVDEPAQLSARLAAKVSHAMDGRKVEPALLTALAEKTGPAIDNLDKCENI